MNSLDKKPVLVFGDIMLDTYWFCDNNRQNPEKDAPLYRVHETKHFLGGAANTAKVLVDLGSYVYLFSSISADPVGFIIQKLLSEIGINDTYLSIAEKSINKIRVFVNETYSSRIDHESNQSVKKEQLLEILELFNETEKQENSVVILSDYNKGFLANGNSNLIIDFFKERNARVIVDPKINSLEAYKGAYLITPNLTEVYELTGIKCNDSKDEQEAVNIIRSYGIENVLITKAEDGMALHMGSWVIVFPAINKNPKTVIGAGDIVVSSIAHQLNCGVDLINAVYKSSYIVAEALNSVGTAKICTI